MSDKEEKARRAPTPAELEAGLERGRREQAEDSADEAHAEPGGLRRLVRRLFRMDDSVAEARTVHRPPPPQRRAPDPEEPPIPSEGAPTEPSADPFAGQPPEQVPGEQPMGREAGPAPRRRISLPQRSVPDSGRLADNSPVGQATRRAREKSHTLGEFGPEHALNGTREAACLTCGEKAYLVRDDGIGATERWDYRGPAVTTTCQGDGG